jgi:large subunit ribosomal protein L19e
MKLENKKALIARSLNVGKNRIALNEARLSELKEAITKQDIKDLKDAGVITVKEKKGRKTKPKRKTRRRAGSIKKKVKTRKQDYVALTRKLRAHLTVLKKRGTISTDDVNEIRKEIRSKNFRSLSHMKERISQSGSEKMKRSVKKHAKNTKAKKKRKKN